MKITGTLIAVLTLLLAGAGFTLSFWRGAKSILVAEFLGLGWLIGAGLVSLFLALGGIALSGPLLIALVAVVCLLLGFAGWKRLQAGLRIETGLAQVPPWEKWLTLLLFIPIVYFIYANFRDALLWDGLVNWEAKARHAFVAGGSLPASYFADATRIRFHPTYPLYLPFSELWIYLWAGDCDQTLVKILFPIFYAATVLVLWSITLRLTSRPWVATLTSFLPIGVPLLTDHGLGLIQGYADFPLAAVYLASVGYLLIWRVKSFKAGWGVAATCAGLLPWIKQDGLLVLAALLAVAALVHGWSHWRRFVVFAIPGIVIALAWRIAMRCVHAVDESVFQAVTKDTLVSNLPRLGVILRFLGWRLGILENWSLLWYWVLVALVYLAWRQRRLAAWLFAALGVPLALDAIPYLFTKLYLPFHLMTSADRLILQVSFIAILSLGLALAPPETPEDALGREAGTGQKE